MTFRLNWLKGAHWYIVLMLFFVSPLFAEEEKKEERLGEELSAIRSLDVGVNSDPVDVVIQDTGLPVVEDVSAESQAMISLDDKVFIEVGDRLSYTVLEDRENPNVLFVDDEGMVDIPLVGSFLVKGKTQKKASFELKKKLENSYYYQATVLLTFFDDSVLGGQITLLGQVSQQGGMDIPPGEVFTVSKAILRAGGFSSGADPARVRVMRRDPNDMRKEIKIDVNVAEILQSGNLDQDIVVKPLDTIFVPTKGLENGKIFVVGEVNSPNTYPLPAGEDFTVTQAILKAGGFTDFANQKSVKLVRGDESLPEEERTLEVNVRRILTEGERRLDPVLKDKDMIIVEENWINF